MITLTVSGADASAVYAAKLGSAIPVILTRALNRAIDTGRTWTRRKLTEETGIQSKYIGRNLAITRATRGTLTATLSAKYSRIPLIAYFRTGFRSGKGIGRVRYKLGTMPPNAFFAEVGKGLHRGIFVRRGRPRTPIEQLLGPGINEVVAKRLIFEALRGPVADAFERRRAHEFARALAAADPTTLSEAA